MKNTAQKPNKTKRFFRGFGRTVASPYIHLFNAGRDLKNTSTEFINTVKNVNQTNTPKARKERLMEDPVYRDAQKILDDKKRFAFMQRENKIDRKEIERRIKIKQRTQLVCSMFTLTLWTMALFFVSKNLNQFNLWHLTLAVLCLLGAATFTGETLKAALHKTQLQDRDLMTLKRFANHPKFYSKLLNPLS